MDVECTLCGMADGRDVLLCDGSLSDGTPCPSKVCLQCARISFKPAGDWFCKGDSCFFGNKRSIEITSTPPAPKNSKNVSLNLPLRDKVLSVTKNFFQVPDVPGNDGAGASSTSNSSAIKDALLLLSAKIDGMHKDMVTLEALKSTKVELLEHFEKTIKKIEAKSLELEKANAELRSRVDALEAKIVNLTAGPDPAFKRLSFIGFKSGSDLERIACVSNFMSSNFPGITVLVGNIMRGPRSARVLTTIVFVEFADSDVRNVVLSQIRSRNLSSTFGGQTVKIKPALTAVIGSRMWP